MTRSEYELQKQNSCNSSMLTSDPQVKILNALKKNDYETFSYILRFEEVDVDFYYDHPDCKSLLDLACSSYGCEQFVRLLLEHKAEINKINTFHSKAPIHFAVETGDVDIVKALLGDHNDKTSNQAWIPEHSKDASAKINILSIGDNTPIHLAIKHMKKIKDEETIKKYEQIVEYLLKSGSNANIPDMKNLTPIYSAAKQRSENIVRLIIQYTKYPLDLDSYKDRSDTTARMVIESFSPELLKLLPSKGDHKEAMDVHKLFSLMSEHDEVKFISVFNEIREKVDLDILFKYNEMNTLLQFACRSGLDKIASVLLVNGADPNMTALGNSIRPIALACAGGYHKILKLLLEIESTSIEPSNAESLLQVVIRENKKGFENENRDYSKCFNMLLDSTKMDIYVNYLDVKENTALHYATRGGNQETILALLRRGACIGLKNKFDETPLSDISAKTLEIYLDECLTTNNERPHDENYEIRFNYSFLVPPTNSSDGKECKIPLMNDPNTSISSNDQFLAPETNILLYMTQNAELKPLLNHPVITSFLFLKWQRMSCLFYGNMTFYALFWLSLILYILLGYGDSDDKTDLVVAVAQITRVLTIIGLLILTMRELLQVIVTPRIYFKSIENWLEICLILVTAVVVFDISSNEPFKQQLSAIAILLSSAELVLLIGQFPSLSTNIVMLKTVSWNFFKFLLWYCILIIAFSFSFYTLFRTRDSKEKLKDKSVKNNPNKSEATEENEETDFFLDPGISLFKTIVMLTGELDSGDINFEAFPITSHVIFVIFVFMIPIVLLNLLNGLAVSDTQLIKANATLLGHVSRIQLISYFESVLLGDMNIYKNTGLNMENVCYWLPIKACMKPLARRICLFPNILPMAKIGVKPNQSAKVVIFTKNQDTNDLELVFCCLRSCDEIEMNSDIVKAAKSLILEREEGDGTEIKKIQELLANHKKEMEKLIEPILNYVRNK